MVLSAERVGRDRLLTGPMVSLMAIAFGALSSFYLLMPVVPEYVAHGRDGGTVIAGLATGALMLGTVVTEFLAPALIGRLGYRAVLAASLLLLGVPAAVLPASSAPVLVLAMCLLRGGGLGVFFVAGASLVAELVPVHRRSEGMGLYGAFVGIPGVLFLPFGVWLNEHAGPRPVFLLGAAFALVAMVAVVRLPAPAPAPSGGAPKPAVKRRIGLTPPAVTFAAVALAGGILPTFLPLSVPASAHRWVALGLLLQSCTMLLARWAAGRFARGDGAALLPASIVLAAAGILGAVWADRPALLVTGMAVFGVGFGAAQNVTLMIMLSRASAADPVAGLRRASMLWNATYDIGIGVGAVAFGALTGVTGQRAGFILLAVLIIAVLPLALRENHPAVRAEPADPV